MKLTICSETYLTIYECQVVSYLKLYLASLQIVRKKKPIQTAHHLLFNCSLLSTDCPPALKSIPPPMFLQYHMNTVGTTSFLKTIFQQLQEELQEN